MDHFPYDFFRNKTIKNDSIKNRLKMFSDRCTDR